MPEDNQPHAGIVTGTYQYDNATLVILRAAEAAEWTRMDQFIALSPPSSFFHSLGLTSKCISSNTYQPYQPIRHIE